MRKGPAVLVCLVAAACSERQTAPPAPPSAPAPSASALPKDAKARLDVLARDDLDASLEESPLTATWLGARGHEDRVDDLRPEAQARVIARLRALSDRTRALAADAKQLDAAHAIDRALLERRAEEALFERTELRPLERNPLAYVDLAESAVEQLIGEEAIPLDRARALAARLWRIRPLLDEARRNLRGPVPELALRRSDGKPGIAIELLQNERAFLVETLPKGVPIADAAVADDFRKALGDASRALDDFAGWLWRDLLPRARGEFAIGRERLLDKLRLAEGLEGVTPEQLVAIGERDLKDARKRYDDAVKAIAGGRPGVDVAKLIEEDHARAEELLVQSQAIAESIVAFVKEHALVTLPQVPRPPVLEMPPLIWGYVQLAIAGPLDPKPRDPAIFVDPVDKSWPEKRRQEHLRAANRSMLTLALANELVGRYVLAERDRRAPTTMQKIALAPALTGGWPAYVERMLVDEGFGDAKLRVVVERAQLLRSARLVAAVRLHALGAKLDDAIKIFTDEAYADEVQARREAERIALDPWSLFDALGRIEIEKLRDDWRAAHPDASLGQFHDALLSHGTPPITTLRAILLPGDHASPL